MGSIIFLIFVIAVLSRFSMPKKSPSRRRRRSSLRQSDIMPMFNSIKRKKAKRRRYFRKFGSF